MRILAFLFPGWYRKRCERRRRSAELLAAAPSRGGGATSHRAASNRRREVDYDGSAANGTNPARRDRSATRPADLGVSADDIVTSCGRCGASVALTSGEYDSARRSGAEIVCPACAAGSRRAATVNDYRAADELPVVVVDSSPLFVIDDSPASVYDSGHVVVVDAPAVFDGGGGDAGGGGSSDTW